MRELRNIEIFVEIANCQSFSKAAKNLLLTPSAVSMSMQRLEDTLGTRLITRTTRQFHLTPDGEAFLECAKQGLVKIHEALDLFNHSKGLPGGPIRISVVSMIGKNVILPALPQFMEEHPEISVELVFNDQMPDLVAEKMDLGLAYGQPEESSYITRLLCKPSTILVASPAYLARHGTPNSPSDLQSHRTIGVRLRADMPPSWTIRERLREISEVHEQLVLDVGGGLVINGSQDCAVDAAVAGLGITLMPSKSVAEHLASGELRQVLPSYDAALTGSESIYLLYPSKAHLATRVRAFIDFLVRITREEIRTGCDVDDAQWIPLASVG
jgi:DNA-binding transcriptional LysR family regulator